MIPKYRAWLKQYNVMVDDVSDLTFFEGNLKFIGRRTVGGVSFQYSVEEIELMQSTGLKDKNNKEIFEGDILKVANNDSSWFEVVKYDHNKAMFISKEMNLKYEVPETPLYDLFSPYLFKVEVIGNIWEDDDLIDGKKANEN
ncbi:YopX family protein [Streptococcus koreensis]|uniref:YopX family protein n=1 Tax=Streptococcus koreensis TaxID=2382163 RepID=UPI0022E5F77F|nr:YopX family protein [Streptococcus koreensis]